MFHALADYNGEKKKLLYSKYYFILKIYSYIEVNRKKNLLMIINCENHTTKVFSNCQSNLNYLKHLHACSSPKLGMANDFTAKSGTSSLHFRLIKSSPSRMITALGLNSPKPPL